MATSTQHPAGDLVARVPSSRDPGLVYQVRLIPAIYTCTCTTFLFWGRCRHATAARAAGLTTPLKDSGR